MSLNIKNVETERLARELVARTGESVTLAITLALRERLDRIVSMERRERNRDAIRSLCEQFERLPDLDPRSPDEILGYDEHGLPS